MVPQHHSLLLHYYLFTLHLLQMSKQRKERIPTGLRPRNDRCFLPDLSSRSLRGGAWPRRGNPFPCFPRRSYFLLLPLRGRQRNTTQPKPPSDEGGGRADARTEGENQKLYILSPSHLTVTAPSSEGAFGADPSTVIARRGMAPTWQSASPGPSLFSILSTAVLLPKNKE